MQSAFIKWLKFEHKQKKACISAGPAVSEYYCTNFRHFRSNTRSVQVSRERKEEPMIIVVPTSLCHFPTHRLNRSCAHDDIETLSSHRYREIDDTVTSLGDSQHRVFWIDEAAPLPNPAHLTLTCQ